jgi:hypothetical protein
MTHSRNPHHQEKKRRREASSRGLGDWGDACFRSRCCFRSCFIIGWQRWQQWRIKLSSFDLGHLMSHVSVNDESHQDGNRFRSVIRHKCRRKASSRKVSWQRSSSDGTTHVHGNVRARRSRRRERVLLVLSLDRVFRRQAARFHSLTLAQWLTRC